MEVKSNCISINNTEFTNEKIYNLKYNNINYILTISSNSESIKLFLKKDNIRIYEVVYTLNDLSTINKVFLAFDSIEIIRKSFDELFSTNRYKINENDDKIEITLQVPVFSELIDINLILKKKELDQKVINEILYEEIKLLKEENKKLKEDNDKLFELIVELNNTIANLSLNSDSEYKFKFRSGANYTLSNNSLTAKKTAGGDLWNCHIIGDREIPKNKLCKWKIKLNNFCIKNNTWNILVGIGPHYDNSKNYHHKCWTFSCGESLLNLKKNIDQNYNGHKGKLKSGDIIEVTVDENRNLYFGVNGVGYGLACSEIPKEEALYPIISIHDQNQIVELLN